MSRRNGPSLLLAAGLSCVAGTAAAQDVDPYELSPEQLFGAEVVSASRSAESVWEAPAAISVITADDIARSGVTSIPEALRLVPGVNVARIGTSGWAISVRGFNGALTNKLLVLIDGREVYDPLFSGVYWDVQDTALQDIARIEVVRGPGASLWGANAVNGVINIITRNSADTQGWMVSADAGEMERSLTARYGGTLGEDTHWRVYGRVFDRPEQERVVGGGAEDDWQAWRGGFRLDSEQGRDSFTLQGDLYHSETGQFRNVPSLLAPYAILTEEDITAEGGNVLARWSRSYARNARLTAQAYVDLTRRDQLTLQDRRTSADVDVQYELPDIGAHNVIAGLRYRFTSDDLTQTPIIISATDTHEEELFSAFVQDEISLGDAWRLTLGSKFDDNDYTGFEIQPTARLQWFDGATQTVWAAASRAVRSPSELEREFTVVTGVVPPGMIPVPVSVQLVPAPGLDSEEVIAYELGYRRQWSPALAMDVALFHNEYEGLSTLTFQPFQVVVGPPLHIILPIASTNDTSAVTNGLEVLFDWRASDTLNVAASYTYLDMELHGPPPTSTIGSEAAEGQAPRNQANIRVHWDISDRLQVDGTVYYVDTVPAFQIDAYTRFDLRLAWRLTEAVQFELIGQNLFDDGHREFGAATDANATNIQRSVFGRLVWRP